VEKKALDSEIMKLLEQQATNARRYIFTMWDKVGENK
jgi:hypothetical protein